MDHEERRAGFGDTLTLHYRISAWNGAEIDSTFHGEPVTLTLGNGELAENLEKCLVGLPVAVRHVFQLDAAQAFGASQPELIQRIPLSDFPPGVAPQEGSLIEFELPNGSRLAGRVESRTQSDALVDFNHPLSDCSVLFEVEVLEIVR